MTWLSPIGREVLKQVVLARGTIPGADAFARSLGFRDRHQLAYRLRCEGLPPLQCLAQWMRIMVWLAEHEAEGTSLCGSALRDARDPAYRYRLVKDVLGIEWTVLEKRGLAWLLLEFLYTWRPKEAATQRRLRISS